MIKKLKRLQFYTSMVICKFLERKSSDDSISSKSIGKISQDPGEENINICTNWKNEGVEEVGLSNDTLSNDTFLLVRQKTFR